MEQIPSSDNIKIKNNCVVVEYNIVKLDRYFRLNNPYIHQVPKQYRSTKFPNIIVGNIP